MHGSTAFASPKSIAKLGKSPLVFAHLPDSGYAGIGEGWLDTQGAIGAEQAGLLAVTDWAQCSLQSHTRYKSKILLCRAEHIALLVMGKRNTESAHTQSIPAKTFSMVCIDCHALLNLQNTRQCRGVSGLLAFAAEAVWLKHTQVRGWA